MSIHLFSTRHGHCRTTMASCCAWLNSTGRAGTVLVVLEYVLANFMNGPYKCLRVFCDSQSAVGILPLNWNKNNCKQLVDDIKCQVNSLVERG